MAATPKYGTATFRGLQSKQLYTIDFYSSDVANAKVNWDSGFGASSSSDTFWRAPEDVALIDISVATGMADTTTWVPTSNNAIVPGQRLRYANFVNTLPFRPQIQIGFAAGRNISFIQQA